MGQPCPFLNPAPILAAFLIYGADCEMWGAHFGTGVGDGLLPSLAETWFTVLLVIQRRRTHTKDCPTHHASQLLETVTIPACEECVSGRFPADLAFAARVDISGIHVAFM